MIHRNVRSHNRHSKNYTFKVAQDRLHEAMPVVQNMVENANKVNSAHILYFSRNAIGKICSCRVKSHVPEDLSHDINNENTLNNTKNSHVVIKHHGKMFGDGLQDDHVDDLFPKKAEDRGLVGDQSFVLGNSIDCGVCYRTGVIPGYTLVGAQSTTISMSSGNIVETSMYSLNTINTPEVFEKLNDLGYVKIACSIPNPDNITKFYYSVRNNRTILFGAKIFDDNNKPILSKEDLLNNVYKRQSTTSNTNEYILYFNVKVKEFTHVVIHALTGMDLYANISEESLSLDYATLNTLSNITLTIPPRLPKVNYGDLIYIPKRNLTLKVSDFSRKNTVDFINWEFTVTARQLQPQESLIALPVFEQIPMY